MNKRKNIIKQSDMARVPTSFSLKSRLVSWCSHDGVCLLLLFVSTLVFYWPILSVKGFMWNDFIEQNFPYRLFAAVSLRKGEFPFWNPYVFSGMPFFADIQSAVLYPLNLLLTIFATEDWLSPVLLEYQIVLHIFMAGVFMFYLAREFKCSRCGSTVSAVIFMFCGFITTHIFHVNMIHCAVWFPLIVLLVKRSIERISLSYATLASAVLCISCFAGYPQLLVHIYYWIAAYYLVMFFFRLKSGTTKKAELRRAALFATIVITSIGLSAVQLLPTQELAQQSARPKMSFEDSNEGSLRPYRLITYLIPKFFGEVGKTDNIYWGIGANDINAGVHNYWETTVYSGVLPLLLAAVAIIFVRTPLVWFLAGIGFVAFLLSMGNSFFMYWLAYKLLPGINRFRIPARFAFMNMFSIALLAAVGFTWIQQLSMTDDRIKKKVLKTVKIFIAILLVFLFFTLVFTFGAFRGSILDFIVESGQFSVNIAQLQQLINERIYPFAVRQVWWFFFLLACSVITLVLGLLNKIKRSIYAFFSLVLLVIDMFVFGFGYASQPQDPSRIYSQTPIIKELRKLAKLEYFRINSRDSNPGTLDLGGRNMIFQKNQGSVHRIFLMEGYNPLRLKRQLVDRRPRTLDILNVKYKISIDTISQRLQLVENTTYLPRARMVFDYVVQTHPEKIYEKLHADDFDHVNSVILEEKPEGFNVPLQVSPQWECRIASYGLNFIKLDVSTNTDGILVLSEIFYQAWKVFIDGVEAAVLRANYALRATVVPKGRHLVEFKFVSEAFEKGALISISFVLLMIAVLVVERFWSNRNPGRCSMDLYR